MAMPTSLLSRRFAVPAESFSARTEDGVELVGTRIGSAQPALILCHGFLGWHRKPRVARLAEALARWFTVYAFDFRGHGRSTGLCTFGDREILDVEAVLKLARADGHERVVTVGASMGGAAVIRHAALVGGVDGVMAVSTPARWNGPRSPAIRRMILLTSTVRGRRLCRALGVRLAATWNGPESPEEVVERISPVPVIVVHGRDDHFFSEEEAWRLYRRAGEPKRLLLASRFGHAEDGFRPEFAERAARQVYELWGIPWPR